MYSTLSVTSLHLPHVIIVKVHLLKTNVVILTPETVDALWCLSCNLALSVRFSIQGEAMDFARSAPQGAHYHADVICLLLNWE